MGAVRLDYASATRPDGKPIMLNVTINGEARSVTDAVTVAQLLQQLGYDRRRVAVEINQEIVPLPRHPEHRLAAGDAVEIVTLVGGGAPDLQPPADKP